MTVKKLKEALTFYDQHLAKMDCEVFGEHLCRIRCEPKQMSQEQMDKVGFVPPFAVLCHLRWMIEECLIKLLVPGGDSWESRVNKAMRWLGYIQGELRAMGHFSIARLEDHSRSEE